MIVVRVDILIEPDKYDDWRRSPELFNRDPQVFAGMAVAELLADLPADVEEARVVEAYTVDATGLAAWRAGKTLVEIGGTEDANEHNPYDVESYGEPCEECGLPDGYHATDCSRLV